LLPIDGERTLVYGSCDAGKHMICSPDVVSELERAAKTLHLAKHKVNGIEIFTAGDVEVHKVVGNTYYMLDLARSFPPEDRQVICLHNSGIESPYSTIYFRMLRPELLLEMKSFNFDEYPPVSPDAFLSGELRMPQNTIFGSTKRRYFLSQDSFLIWQSGNRRTLP
jgi:hypothetical protein